MRAIMVMFDSLRRDLLPCYGGDSIAPNFTRLAERAVTFDRFYAASLPCMPARRELHTGRYNFLHRGWMPLEPFDDSMPQLLGEAGIDTHLVSDHYHYWTDGGSNYHGRYTTWNNVRGQEGDSWQYQKPVQPPVFTTVKDVPGPFAALFRQDAVNRPHMDSYQTHPQTRTFDGGVDFIEKHHDSQDWFLQIEAFDPHEPFFASPEYASLYDDEYDGREVDWPQPFPIDDNPSMNRHIINRYRGLLAQCDHSLGRVLDLMDRYNMWDDTMLIVNTDHGLMLSEHGWWGKGTMPPYNEIVNLPFLLWDPRHKEYAGSRCQELAQTIDIPSTLLELFGLPLPADMQGKPIPRVFGGDALHDYLIFGYHGGHACITDGEILYMRGPVHESNGPLNDYTLIPTTMHSRASIRTLAKAELCPPFSFTKGCPVLRLPKDGSGPFGNMHRYGSLLFDLRTDPHQNAPLDDPALEARMVQALVELMQRTDAPPEQYERLGLTPPKTDESKG